MHTTETTPIPEKRLMIICQKRQLQNLMDEFEDWNTQQGIEIRVLLYGTMQKSDEGFVLFALNKPLPECVYTNLVVDPDILDYVHYENPPQTPQST